MNKIKGTSLFANVGIDEYYFKDLGIEMVLSNELLEDRAKFYSHIYPKVDMLCGDITDEKIFNELVEKHKKYKSSFLLATPPCQGMSVAGKMDKNDKRNLLITSVIEFRKPPRTPTAKFDRDF